MSKRNELKKTYAFAGNTTKIIYEYL